MSNDQTPSSCEIMDGSSELLDLLCDLRENRLSEHEMARLDAMLLDSETNRAAYIRFMGMVAQLEWEHGEEASPPMEFAAHAPAISAAVGDNHRRVAVIAAALLALVMGTVVVWWARSPASQSVEPTARQTTDLPPESGMVIRLDRQDTRTIALSGVGSMAVQGPADLELIGSSRVRITQGRIRVRIDGEEGKRFFVETPHGEVTDLGTEFGIDVTEGRSTDVLVFEGSVELTVPREGVHDRHIKRLHQGEGLTIDPTGHTARIMSVSTGMMTSTFRRPGEDYGDTSLPTIIEVSDNIRADEVKTFYEIVPGGMAEDALAYVDRPAHDWNGITTRGMPDYLVGADYVKTFNSDKMSRDVEISVTLSRPARLFILLDVRVEPPDWLVRDFRDTGDLIGLDTGPYAVDGVTYMHDYERGSGPGVSVDEYFAIWERIVPEPGVVRLGPNASPHWDAGMYGIAAIPLEVEAITRQPVSLLHRSVGVGQWAFERSSSRQRR